MKIDTTAIYVLVGVLGPGLVTVGARYLGQGPATSGAQTIVQDAQGPVHFPEISVSLGHAVAGEQGADEIVSPFWFQEFNESLFADPLGSEMHDGGGQVGELFSQVVVTSILPHPTRPLAIINSKPCKIGDEIDGQWKLVEINGSARTVTLVHKSGKQQVVELANITD